MMAHCVVSTIVDTNADDAIVPACMVHTHYAPCPHDGEPAFPGPIHSWPRDADEREKTVKMWRLRTHRQRPLILHDLTRIADIEDHVCEDEVLPCPCHAEVIPPDGAA